MVTKYLEPLIGQQKSFYSKATVSEFDNGDKVLYSYGTEIMICKGGNYYRIWDGYSMTTMKHIKAFTNGLVNGKADYIALEPYIEGEL